MTDVNKLMGKARLSYEGGRLAMAAKSLFITVPVALFAALTCIDMKAMLLASLALVITTLALKWRGQNFNHGANVGLFVGLMGFLIPMSLHAAGLCCKYEAEMAICVTSGVLMGSFVAWRASVQAAHSLSFFIASASVAILTGLLGCLGLGAGGIIGLMAGVLMVAAPYAMVRLARQA